MSFPVVNHTFVTITLVVSVNLTKSATLSEQFEDKDKRIVTLRYFAKCDSDSGGKKKAP